MTRGRSQAFVENVLRQVRLAGSTGSVRGLLASHLATSSSRVSVALLALQEARLVRHSHGRWIAVAPACERSQIWCAGIAFDEHRDRQRERAAARETRRVRA